MLSVGMVHIFIIKIKGCKNTKCHILYADVNKTTKYSACGKCDFIVPKSLGYEINVRLDI